MASLLYDIKGARAFNQGELTDPRQLGVIALGRLTLQVELEQPASYFLQLLAHNVAYPVPRHVVEAYGDAWTDPDNLVSNGPFLLEGMSNAMSEEIAPQAQLTRIIPKSQWNASFFVDLAVYVLVLLML